MINHFRDEYSWLSNMQLVDIKLRGRVFPSVEHAYCSEKNNDAEWKDMCADRDLSSAGVKKMSKEIKLRDDWDDVKLLVMEHCLKLKFNQEPFRTKLIETGNQNIVEGNYWNDLFWGVDIKVTPNIGENHLGRLIMKIRNNLNK